ncbi:site-specific DNA-methyltransferase [Shewanella xiamenensis]|uniref:site-specific DNA-methyltransferase n=1 Tax=Shewanella xiamenensis TaxID=332186 RepID=UPI001C502433|nr:DNA methyltransferase [Shewanella xiamenensis]MBW0281487.1 site-specific DNA-methyltransferase [Shewanella xiamenensis]MCT8872140.1 site-specific DNA-methyltransferase [Shewanella xiamenensis]UWH40047.1 site-specific DNA-methyltransferase [Shewanella xiamenensis]
MEKLKMHSPNLVAQNIEQLAALFPSCVTESRGKDGKLKQAIDFDLLKQELSSHIVEGPQERYELNWPGKREALLTANAPIAKTLRPCRDESVDFDTTKNLFIEGDNLDALKLLQETYLGKVKMIYIDPPYNTGNDFIYNDDFAEDVDSYVERSNQKDETGNRLVANTESNGRFHSDWLSMIYSRLKLAANMLRDDGIIFISIDDNELSNLISLCDEVFGDANRVGILSIVSNLKGRSDDKYYATAHNNLIVYKKSNFISYGVPLPAEYVKDYKETDSQGRKYRLQGLRKRGNSARRVDRPNMFYPFFVNPATLEVSVEKTEGFSEEVFPYLSDGEEGRWRWGIETSKERISELTCRKVGAEDRYDIFQVDYAEGVDGEKRIKPKSIWMGSEFANEAGTLELKSLFNERVFDTPKPTGLVKYCLEHSVERDDIVLDFFAGSGTSAHAVMDFNYEKGQSIKWILVQLPEQLNEKSEIFNAGFSHIADIAKERIKRAGQKILEKSNGKCIIDVGFRALKVDSSNMSDVYYTPDAITQTDLFAQVENVKDDRTEEDLLFQVMLDWGVDLTLPIRRETLAGRTVFFVDADAKNCHGALVACFDKTGAVDETFIKALAAFSPLRLVFRDAGFASDAAKINVEQLLKQLSPTTDVKTI